MTPIKPLVSLDNQGWERQAEALLGGDSPAAEPTAMAPTSIRDPENWLLLDGRSHGAASYLPLFVSMHRLSYGPEVDRAAKRLGLTVANSGVESDGHQYIGNVNWSQALSLNDAVGNQTLTPRQGIDLMLDLREALDGKKVILNGRGNSIDKDRLRTMYNEIWEVRDPWRAEHLDARFSNTGGAMRMAYGHQLQGTNLVARANDVLLPYLTENGAKADLATFNPQGLATKKSRSATLHFWQPSDGSVARFGAGSSGAVLFCVGDPQDSGANLGVRPARAKI